MIINLISGPRNISTAMMYSFAQRSDTKVIDEPFYAHYLLKTGLKHPGSEEIIASMESDSKKIIRQIQELEKESKLVFLKNMAHHHEGLDWEYLLKMKNVFLIRDPKQMITSFAQVIAKPTLQDIGLQLEIDLLEFILSKGADNPIVIDSDNILKNPEEGLKKLCARLEIPHDSSMLKWKAEPIKEDGSWAKYWYKNIHNSTGFTKQKTSDRPLSDHCKPLYEEALPYYEKLASYIK